MQAAAKIQGTIPMDRRIELRLPEDLPVGPAEVIILVPLPNAPADRLAAEEALLDAGAETALEQDGRFRADGELVGFQAELGSELQDELDHRRDREQRIDKLGQGL
ncbi:hypothetical protein WMF31_05950 [Sorangium sp. So ce1036]|uniref:hypothetical protein n=1 Tax=Sorangium sp. So ce1036 TaxID=3133328 RepID=UPI003F016D54